jgi:hypothetical protein
VAASLAFAGLLFAVLAGQALAPGARRRAARLRGGRPAPAAPDFDPGRERRAEQRARELLRSCVGEREWAMYRDLGFISVAGGIGPRPAGYAYLIYPHRPIVAYVPGERRLLSEYCVRFPDGERPYGSDRLPDADDVLAKWLALTADERCLVGEANMHLPGRQIDPDAVRGDITRLERWEGAGLPADANVRAA